MEGAEGMMGVSGWGIRGELMTEALEFVEMKHRAEAAEAARDAAEEALRDLQDATTRLLSETDDRTGLWGKLAVADAAAWRCLRAADKRQEGET